MVVESKQSFLIRKQKQIMRSFMLNGSLPIRNAWQW
jgi:hypothetical protein